MSRILTIMVLLVAFLAVYLQTAIGWPRNLTYAQVDLLPAIMVYVALTGNIWHLTLVGCAGGLFFDSLSANPLGVSVLPLFLVGLLVQSNREMILRELTYAQFLVGLAASTLTPALTVVLLSSIGAEPIIGAGSLWQWFVMALGGAVFTPILFIAFDLLDSALSYRNQPPPSEIGREDREIKRGRR